MGIIEHHERSFAGGHELPALRKSKARMERRTRPDRRGGRFRFVFFDKRTGFDRRYDNGTFLATLRSSDGSIVLLLIAINILNVLDLIFTKQALQAGAQEANPVLAVLFSHDPLVGAVVKVGVIAAASAIFWAFRKYKPVLQTLIAAAAIFGGVVLYHTMLRATIMA